MSTTSSGIAETVTHGTSGLLVALRDPGVFATALDRLLNDELLRRRLTRAARAQVEEHFDLARNVAVLIDLLGEAAAHVRQTPA